MRMRSSRLAKNGLKRAPIAEFS